MAQLRIIKLQLIISSEQALSGLLTYTGMLEMML